MRVVVILLLVYTTRSASSIQPECGEALGMISGNITDDDVSASSSYDAASVGPHNGRINVERAGGAWCPARPLHHDAYEWLQVDFHHYTLITGVEIQGRFGNGQGQEFAEWFKLDYQRTDRSRWIRYKNHSGSELFQGNVNTYKAEYRKVQPPVLVRSLRVVPFSLHERTLCMRIELYGCPLRDGVISYSIPQGDRRGSEVDLYDFTYDGEEEHGFLSGGLGQLVDGEQGETNFRLDPHNLGKKGYQWIGWKNDTGDRPPIELLFEFDVVRNFTAVRIFSNNLFTKDVRVFRTAKLYFSVSGQVYQETPLLFNYMRDALMEFARYVIIHVPHRYARFVKIHLYFDDRWLLISEVKFDSVPAKGNYTDELQTPPSSGTQPHPHGTTVPQDEYFYDHNSDTPGRSLDDQYIGIIVGTLAALILLLTVLVLLVIVRKRKLKSHAKETQPEPQQVTLNLNDLRAMNAVNSVNAASKLSNGNLYNGVACSEGGQGSTVYEDPQDAMLGRKLPDLPRGKPIHDSGTDTMTSCDYAVPDMASKMPTAPPMYAGEWVPPPYPSDSTSPPPYPYAVYGGHDMQGLSGNSLYALPNTQDFLAANEPSLVELLPENLRFLEKLGEGQFGEVHLCEAVRLPESVLSGLSHNQGSCLVAVKTLHARADTQARADFYKEMRIMFRLRDDNVVRVLGVCTQADPMCVIVEYMMHGDLHQYLQTHSPAETTLTRRPRLLSYGALVYMATQIASGMKYLESLNMVHRDLATRNCLVGAKYMIKISDFGMSRSLYSRDYYRIEGKAVLPIRWMAWESLLLGKFSTKSDVWAFGVTFWEILTFAKEQPFSYLTDDGVIENCGHFFRNDHQECYLPQPASCPREIYDLLLECWNREESHRPAFMEVHMFLQRKNMGYQPGDDMAPGKYNSLRAGVPVV